MRTLLKICDDYSKQFSIVFNAAKSACLLVTSSKSLQRLMKKPEFYIGGKPIEFVNLFNASWSKLLLFERFSAILV